MDNVLHSVGERGWWLFLTQGALSILFGILLLVWPGETLSILIGLFALFTVLSGILGLFAAIGAASSHQSWGWQMVLSILGILVGLIILKWPAPTVLVIVLFVGFWAITSGLVSLVSAIAHQGELPHAWLMALSGVATLFFGMLLLFWPSIGLLSLIYLAGIYAIVYGVISCVIAWRVRSYIQQATHEHPAFQ